MKRKFNYLIAMALMAFTFTSCEDVPSPFGEVVPPKGDDVIVIEPSGTGTEADPFNIAGVIEYVSGLGADVASPKDVYFKGIITSITEAYGTQYGNATFEVSDTEDGGNKFLCYRVKYFNNQGYSNPSDPNIKEGDEVIMCGKVVNYKGNTPETSANAAWLYSLNGTKGGGGTTPQPGGDAKGKGTADDPFNIAAAIKKCQEVGETASAESYYIKGIVVKGGTASGGYGNVTFTLGDSKDATDVFTAFQVAGSDGEKLADGFEVKAGSEVVIYGPVVNYKGNTPETSGKSAAQIVTIDGKKTSGGGDNPPVGGNDGSLEKPFTPAEANAFIATLAADTNTDKDYYIKGKIVKYANNGEFGTQYGNASFYISADGSESGEQFYVFRTLYLGNVKYTDDSWTKPVVGNEVVICGKLVNYKGNTPETVANQSYIYSLNGNTEAGGGGSQGGGSETSSALTNGDFETWANGQPTGWKSASTASSATLEQSTDAHSGSYACIVKGDEGNNKRLASQEIKLAAGTYNLSFWVKPTTSDVAQVRPGYVPVADGKAGSYAYGDYATLSAGWQQISYEFTLSAETTVCLVVMNPKKSNYSSGKDVIVDDATLTKK